MFENIQEIINELHRMKKEYNAPQGCCVRTQERNGYRSKCLSIAIKALSEVQSLAKAKAEGRLVVLPCKVGDTVYHRSGQHTIDDIQLFYPRQNGHVPEERIGKLQIRLGSLNYAGLQTFATYADEIGKTVFLTRAEAEEALKEVQHE
jgi:hypothetical protein